VFDIYSARKKRLKTVSRSNVLTDALDVAEEILFFIAGLSRNSGCLEIGGQRLQRRGHCQTGGNVVQLFLRCVVQPAQLGVVRFGRNRHGDDEASRSTEIVEDHERACEDEQRLWNVGPGTAALGETLDEANDIVAEIADRARPEVSDFRIGAHLGIHEQ
jgi:hypothetical protein